MTLKIVQNRFSPSSHLQNTQQPDAAPNPKERFSTGKDKALREAPEKVGASLPQSTTPSSKALLWFFSIHCLSEVGTQIMESTKCCRELWEAGLVPRHCWQEGKMVHFFFFFKVSRIDED